MNISERTLAAIGKAIRRANSTPVTTNDLYLAQVALRTFVDFASLSDWDELQQARGLDDED